MWWSSFWSGWNERDTLYTKLILKQICIFILQCMWLWWMNGWMDGWMHFICYEPMTNHRIYFSFGILFLFIILLSVMTLPKNWANSSLSIFFCCWKHGHKKAHTLPFSCPCRSLGERSEVVRLGKGRFGWCNYFLLYRFRWTYGKNFTTIGHYKNALIASLPLLNWFRSIFVNFFIGCLKFHVFIFAMSIAQVIVFLHFKKCAKLV